MIATAGPDRQVAAGIGLSHRSGQPGGQSHRCGQPPHAVVSVVSGQRDNPASRPELPELRASRKLAAAQLAAPWG